MGYTGTRATAVERRSSIMYDLLNTDLTMLQIAMKHDVKQATISYINRGRFAESEGTGFIFPLRPSYGVFVKTWELFNEGKSNQEIMELLNLNKDLVVFYRTKYDNKK